MDQSLSPKYNIYIPKTVHDRIVERKEYLGKQVEQKNPNIILKYTGLAYLKQTILIKFTDRIPKFVMYDDAIFGTVTAERTHETDVCYPIHQVKNFTKYLHNNDEFFLSVGYINDGSIGGYFSKILGCKRASKEKSSSHIFDFTDYDTWE